MKTTVELSATLLAEAKAVAVREKTTLRALIEQGLRHVLENKWPRQPYKMRDLSVDGGGLSPEFEAKGGWAKMREAAYPGFFDDEDKGEQ